MAVCGRVLPRCESCQETGSYSARSPTGKTFARDGNFSSGWGSSILSMADYRPGQWNSGECFVTANFRPEIPKPRFQGHMRQSCPIAPTVCDIDINTISRHSTTIASWSGGYLHRHGCWVQSNLCVSRKGRENRNIAEMIRHINYQLPNRSHLLCSP